MVQSEAILVLFISGNTERALRKNMAMAWKSESFFKFDFETFANFSIEQINIPGLLILKKF